MAEVLKPNIVKSWPQRLHARANEALAWLADVIGQYGQKILAFDAEAAQVWGRLRVPHPEHGLEKQVAAIALVNDLTVVTRNATDFSDTGVRLTNPFLSARL